MLLSNIIQDNTKMNENEEYIFFYRDRNIIINTGKKTNITGEIIYYAQADFNNVFAVAECKEKALENCVKKIKFVVSLLEKDVKLISQPQAITLAKKYFEENFTNKELIKNGLDALSYNVVVEDEIFIFSVTAFNSHESVDSNKMNVIAIVYINLVTSECDMIENRRAI